MAKIIILGSRDSANLASQINAKLIEVPDLYENDFGMVNDFVVDKLKQEFDILVIDAESIKRPDVALALGMYLRLSVTEVRSNALVPIIFTSEKTIKSFFPYKPYSQLLLTPNVYFEPREAIIIDAVKPLDATKYEDDFLSFIRVNPGPEAGNHSLANQWGASVLDRLLNNGVSSGNSTLDSVSKMLYFKYVLVQTFNVADYLSRKEQPRYAMLNRTKIHANGKRILLIDDEADKGWEYVLKRMIVTNDGDFDVVKRKVASYDAFTKEEKKQIKEGNYDLIFLDLRMNGVAEENIYKPDDFSGMKILKQIKKDSQGTQVIMFTASNKAWNLKALLDAGADGYYIKESPEYKFSNNFSIANYDALRENVQNCLKRSYLRDIDTKIKDIRRLFNINITDLKKSVLNQLAVSYELLKGGHFEFAYISLYQTIELINDEYLDRDDNGVWYIVETNEDAKSWTTKNFRHECVEAKTKEKDNVKYPEWQKMASLYYQLWKQTDKSFGYQIQTLINERNSFMHNDSNNESGIHNEKGYLNLFNAIEKICILI